MKVFSNYELSFNPLKKVLLIIFCLMANKEIFSQEYKFAESSISAAYGTNESEDLVSDKIGNFYYLVKFSDEITFMEKLFEAYKDPIELPNGGTDLLLIKIDSVGELKWVNQIGSIDSYYSPIITADSEGNIVFTGTFRGITKLNNNTLPLSGSLLAKFSAENGDLIWIKKLGLKPTAMIADSSNNIYLAGDFSNEGSIDSIKIKASNHGSYNTSSDMFVAKLDPKGKAIWINRGGAKFDKSLHNLYVSANDISINSKGEVFVTGQGKRSNDVFDDIYFDSIPFNFEYRDGYIAKLSNEGKFMWVQGNFKEINNIEIDINDNLIVSGTYTKDISNDYFSLNEISEGKYAYVAKIYPSLKLSWVKKIKGSSYLFLSDLDLDKFGNIFTTGEFRNSVISDNKSLSTADGVNFIAKIDINGILQSFKKIPTAVWWWSRTTSVSVNNSGLIGFTGKVEVVKAFGNFIVEPGLHSYQFVVGAFSLEDEEIITENLSSFQNTKTYTYPNPANSGITIENPNLSEEWEVLIFDQLGILIKSENVLKFNEIYVDLSTLSEGLYLVKLVSNTKSISEKLTIRR